MPTSSSVITGQGGSSDPVALAAYRRRLITCNSALCFAHICLDPATPQNKPFQFPHYSRSHPESPHHCVGQLCIFSRETLVAHLALLPGQLLLGDLLLGGLVVGDTRDDVLLLSQDYLPAEAPRQKRKQSRGAASQTATN